MNKELEQQAREWWRKRHMEYQYSPKREHILPSTDFQMESDLAAFAAHLEAQSKPIQDGELVQRLQELHRHLSVCMKDDECPTGADLSMLDSCIRLAAPCERK